MTTTRLVQMQREIVKADDLNLPNGEYGSHFATTVGHEYFKMQGSVTVSCSNGTIIIRSASSREQHLTCWGFRGSLT